MIDERPIRIITYVLFMFSFVAYFSICIYSESVDPSNSIDRYFLTTVISVVFGSFMKALHTFGVKLIIGFGTTYTKGITELSSMFKNSADLGMAFTIMYTFFALSIGFFLGFLTFITVIITMWVLIYALKNVQR